MLFPGARASCDEKFLDCVSVFMGLKIVSQIFKILFQTGNTDIFVLRYVFFSRYVQLKNSFSDEKKHQR